mgnify:CR=1 FL=1
MIQGLLNSGLELLHGRRLFEQLIHTNDLHRGQLHRQIQGIIRIVNLLHPVADDDQPTQRKFVHL